MEPTPDLKSVLKTWLYLDDFDMGEPSPSLMVQEGDTCDVVQYIYSVWTMTDFQFITMVVYLGLVGGAWYQGLYVGIKIGAGNMYDYLYDRGTNEGSMYMSD